MTLLFNVGEGFDFSGRGCVIVSALPIGADFKIQARDQIQLRTPGGLGRCF
jgi:hypothetical protein